MKTSESIWILGIVLITSNASAQLNLTNGQYNFRIFRSPSGLAADTLRYWVRPPDGFSTSERLPLLVHMHGTGNKPDDFLMDIFEQGTGQWDNRFRCTVIQPLVPHDQGNWTNDAGNAGNHPMDAQPTHGIRMVMELVKYLQAQMNVDPARVYVEGASMGGYASWDLILRWPELFAAACPMAGGGDSSNADRIVSMAVRIYHGAGDYAAPVSGSRAMAKALHQRHANVNYYEVPPGQFPDNTDGHADGWIAAWRDTTFWPWMFFQSRTPDVTPPSAPTGFTATVAGNGDRVSLSWLPSTDAESGTVAYHIYRNTFRIASTIATAYTDSLLAASTDYQYEVAAYNPCDKVSARTPAVQVRTPADNTPPLVNWARTITPSTVSICFSEGVSSASANAAANYAVSGGVAVTSAALQSDSRVVRLAVTGLVFGQTYVVTVNNITDSSPAANMIPANSTVSFSAQRMGYVAEEEWWDIPGGFISNLTGSTAFGGAPNRIDTLRRLDNARTGRANYGARVRGYLLPHETGPHTFWISSHEASQLFVSPTADPVRKQLTAQVQSALPLYEYDFTSDQKSAPIQMTRDTPYYFEILFKQASSYDAYMVAWLPPNATSRAVVQAENLVPWSVEEAPTIPIVATGRESARLRLYTGNAQAPVICVEYPGDHRVSFLSMKGTIVVSRSANGPAVYRLAELAIPDGMYCVRVTSGGATMLRRVVNIR